MKDPDYLTLPGARAEVKKLRELLKRIVASADGAHEDEEFLQVYVNAQLIEEARKMVGLMKNRKIYVALMVTVEGQRNPPVTRQLEGDLREDGVHNVDLDVARAVCAAVEGAELDQPEYPVVQLRPRSEWSEEDGPVVWYKVPIEEPPWCGTPLDSDWPEEKRLLPYTHWHALPKVVV